MKKLYVAYGSNLHLEQMAARCPSATIFGVGRLNNWVLLYRGREGNAHATIARKKGSSVPVLIWNIEPEDERRLDMYEGYPRYYFKQDVMVDIGGQKKKAMVYIMNLRQQAARPSRSYVETIRQGYLDNDLDMEFFEESLNRNRIECV
jgi:gamma-glutamylcyclotransferase (GGCT)/AIG2-like uncharacterized protein YtfP